MAFRKYSDEDRSTAVAFLLAAGWAASADDKRKSMAVDEASRKTGVGRHTLKRWAAEEIAGERSSLAAQKRGDLAARLEEAAHVLLDTLLDGRLEDASIRDVAVALGIAIDKRALLLGLPTETIQQNISVNRQGLSTLPSEIAPGADAGDLRTPAVQRSGMWPALGQNGARNGLPS